MLLTEIKTRFQVAENNPDLIALDMCKKFQIFITVLRHIESVHRITGITFHNLGSVMSLIKAGHRNKK